MPAIVKVAPYFQPLALRSGGRVTFHRPRGGKVVATVESIDYRSSFAKSYGPRVRTDHGTCTVADVLAYTPPPRMTPSQLRANVESRGTESHFFNQKTMRFFGDTMRNYGCRPAVIDTHTEAAVPVWELYRRRPVKNGLRSSNYFRQDSFARVTPKPQAPSPHPHMRVSEAHQPGE
jgi:hypothetical protein